MHSLLQIRKSLRFAQFCIKIGIKLTIQWNFGLKRCIISRYARIIGRISPKCVHSKWFLPRKLENCRASRDLRKHIHVEISTWSVATVVRGVSRGENSGTLHTKRSKWNFWTGGTISWRNVVQIFACGADFTPNYFWICHFNFQGRFQEHKT